MTKDINNMIQAEFDNLMAEVKVEDQNLFQFIVDFVNRKVTSKEVDDFNKMYRRDQVDYIKNNKARA